MATSGADISPDEFSTQQCSLHPSKVVDMFCEEHDEVACASCIALNHGICTTIFSIPEKIDDLYNSTEMTEIKQKINKTKKAVEDIKKAKEQKAKELNDAYEKEVNSFIAFRKQLQTLLDNAEQELKQHFDRVESCLTSEIKEINNLIDHMNEVLKKAEGNKAQEFVSMKISKKVTAKAEDVEKVQPGKTEEPVSFTADQCIEALLQKIQALGNRLYKVNCQREINVKLVNDSTDCWLICACLTEDGTLLLTDYNNKRLKRLDLSTEMVKDYLDLQAGPYDVCLVSMSEAVVTLDNETVQFVSLGNKLSAARVLKMGHYCSGVAHTDGTLFISDAARYVYIHDMNGKKLKRISTNASDDAIFTRTHHLTVNLSGDRVFVADYDKGVVVLDKGGNYLSTHTFPLTMGVCTDARNLFVSGFSKNIFQIGHVGQDFKLMGELVKVDCPYSLCFDQHKTRLIVTHASDKNTITVLELK